MKLLLHKVESPLGQILLVSDTEGRVRALDFEDYTPRLHRLLLKHYGDYVLMESDGDSAATEPLRRYFSGELNALTEVPVATNGSAFQQQVWAALRKIPCGTTSAYGELASQLGLNGHHMARAVGVANGLNPIAIIVPCHRVIGKGGDLRGFAGGLHRKEWLLTHEGALIKPAEAPQHPLF